MLHGRRLRSFPIGLMLALFVKLPRGILLSPAWLSDWLVRFGVACQLLDYVEVPVGLSVGVPKVVAEV